MSRADTIKQRWSRMDRISELPDNAIDNIIERLPLRDAVRTSIVSRTWQYKWAMLSTLSLDICFVRDMYGDHECSETFPGLAKTILLQHIGPLHKFVICIRGLSSPRATAEITLLIRVALMNGVQELTVDSRSALCILPSFLFSCGELTKLDLVDCVFKPPFGFRGFPNLKTFVLGYCDFDSERLSCFVSSCPKLHEVVILEDNQHHLKFRTPSLESLGLVGNFRSIILEEAPNLVSLAIAEWTSQIEETVPCNDHLLQLFSTVAKIKYLGLGSQICHLLGTDCAPSKLPTTLHNLKTFHADAVNLGCVRQFNGILRLIMSSPNLQHLQITVDKERLNNNLGDLYVESGDYKDCSSLQLRSVKMKNLRGSKAEWKLVEILLGNSPVLQNLSTEIDIDVNKASFSKKLMQFRRASPAAQVSCVVTTKKR